MIYQSLAQKYKWKAISILHEKTKLILAQRGPRGATRVHTRACGGPKAARGPHAEAARGEEARTHWHLQKCPRVNRK